MRGCALAEFFVVCPIGFENDLAQELREIEGFLLGAGNLPTTEGYQELEPQKGGVRVQADPLIGLQIHFFSKLASRLLLRLKRFRALEFSLLERELKKIDPTPWIGAQTFSLKVSSQKSKLGQEKRIFETAQRAWKQLKEDGAQEFYLRAENDEFELSLDLTGEHLHRRGSGRDLGGVAPIRETLAAALLRFLIGEAPLSRLQNVTLLDPMAGSGTLLAEASRLYQPNFDRAYAFQSQKWIPKILLSPTYGQNYRGFGAPTWAGLMGADQKPEARARLESLAEGLTETLETFAPGELPSGTNPRWVVSNPPYGERLQKIPAEDLVRILLEPKPERVAVILPEALALELERRWPRENAPTGGPLWSFSKQRVLNGGIPCLLAKFVKNF